MPTRTETVTYCTNCGKKSCDGGMWKIIKVVNIKDGKDTTSTVHHENIHDCTLRFFGTKKEYRDVPVGTVITKDYRNWSPPATVTIEKYEE